MPPPIRDDDHPWPLPRGTYFLDYSHAEGVAKFGSDPRQYATYALEFLSDSDNHVTAAKIDSLSWEYKDGKWHSTPIGESTLIPADLVLLAIGFTGHDTPLLIEQLAVATNNGTITADYGSFTTNVPGIFTAGDCRRGASLIVWAIAEGRGAARQIDSYLNHQPSSLPAPDLQPGHPSTAD